MLITVGAPPVEVELSNRVRAHCLLLRSLLPNSSLPKVHFTTFSLVLSYLDGDNDLTRFVAHTHDTTLLLNFARAWSFAAQLKLPLLQNKLVSVMTDIYNESLEKGTDYPADDDLFKAFRHLRDECGNDSHAEKFLTSFVGRTTLSILVLKTQLRNKGFDPDVRNNLVAEARSLSRDAIKYTRYRFLVDVARPPRYRSLEIRVNPSDHALLPPYVPAARDQQEPGQRRTYQATILSPLNISITTNDGRTATIPGSTQSSGRVRATSQRPLRITNAGATERTSAQLGISPPEFRRQEETMVARPAGTNAPKGISEVPTNPASRNTSAELHILASRSSTIQANNVATTSPVPSHPPSPPPSAVQVDAPPTPEDSVLANILTHRQHIPTSRTFWGRLFGRNKEPAAPLPIPRLKRRPRYHNHRYCQVYSSPVGIHIRYRGDGDSGGTLPPRGGLRLASSSPERSRGGECRGRHEGDDSPEPRCGGQSDDSQMRRGRWGDGWRYEEVIDVNAWRPRKKDSRTKVCCERRRWNE
jgi:hypothetical protein